MYVDLTDSEGCKQIGLDLLVLIDGGGYDWASFAVWLDHRDGQLVYGFDSGCSCSSPFDGGLEGLKRVPKSKLVEIEWDAIAWQSENSHYVTREELSTTLTALREKLK